MTKPEMIAEVAKQVGITKADAGRALDCIVRLVADALVDNGRIDVTGLGVLTVKTLAAQSRPNIHDRTKMVDTPARNTVKFKPCPALKAAVQ
jgi:DNA-binding protein HU-beta